MVRRTSRGPSFDESSVQPPSERVAPSQLACASLSCTVSWNNNDVSSELAELYEQVSAVRDVTVEDPTSYLDVAFGILSRWEPSVEAVGTVPELRFLRACLAGGHAKTRLLVRGSVDPTVSRRTSSCARSCLELNGHVVAVQPSVGPVSPKSGRKEKSLRPGFQHRGALQRTRYLNTDAAKANPDLVVEAQKQPLARCPWMGPVIPRWPAITLADELIKSVDQMVTQEFNDWGFDVFTLNVHSRGRPLTFAGWEALLRVGAFSEFDLAPQTTSRFLQLAEDAYSHELVVPYHNPSHAADVVQTIFAMMTNLGFKLYFDAMDHLAFILAAVIHDVGHDGKSNNFHIDMRDELALRYNDQSVLENHALTTSFRLLNNAEKGSNMLAGLTREQYQILRKEVVDMVLATDMAVHHQVCGKFRESLGKCGRNDEQWQASTEAMFALRAMLLHSCDISNLTKPFYLSTQWTTRCLQELFAQGDAERSAGVPISPLCDRHSLDVASSQIGFLSIIVQPTFEQLGRMAPKVRDVCLVMASRNSAEWVSRKKRKTDAEELRNVLVGMPHGVARSASAGDGPGGAADLQEDAGVGQDGAGSAGEPGVLEEEVAEHPHRGCSCWAPGLSVVKV